MSHRNLYYAEDVTFFVFVSNKKYPRDYGGYILRFIINYPGDKIPVFYTQLQDDILVAMEHIENLGIMMN